jgi:hypothetical protein
MQPLFGQQISAYPSQAETTLTQYAGGVAGGRKPQTCWGCGSLDHVWRKGKGKILCPKKDDPAVQNRAHEAHMKYVADLCARGGGNRNPGDHTPRGDKATSLRTSRGSTGQVPASFFRNRKNKWAEVPRHSLL